MIPCSFAANALRELARPGPSAGGPDSDFFPCVDPAERTKGVTEDSTQWAVLGAALEPL